jgi:uncharacterized membrane protein AbrB (regulator of aidB expression)
MAALPFIKGHCRLIWYRSETRYQIAEQAQKNVHLKRAAFNACQTVLIMGVTMMARGERCKATSTATILHALVVCLEVCASVSVSVFICNSGLRCENEITRFERRRCR